MKKKRFIRSGIIAVLGVGIITLTAHADIWDKPSGSFRGIKASKHNLSNWSLYTIKGDTTQVCIFCHAPHNTDSVKVPLWNRNDTAVITFTMATTQYVTSGRTPPSNYTDSQPTTISKKCLSCHDGTIAIGDIRNGGPITMAVSSKLDPDGSLKGYADGNPFGGPNYDLRGGHVISFNYKSFYNDPALPPARKASFKDWDTLITQADKNSMFDRDGKMQCHTCHDPHTDWCDDSNKTIGKDPLWRKACDAGKNDSVCKTCHTVFAEYTAPNLKF